MYTQTKPWIALLYLGALFFQRVAHKASNKTKTGFLWGLIVGPQGILATNAIITLASAFLTVLVGSPELAISGFLFGSANFTQSVVYACAVSFSDRMKHSILVACEFAIAFGLAMIAVNAGYPVFVSFGLIIPVLIAGVVRTFRAHWLPSGLAYADMMFLSAMTCYEAVVTANPANAVSRVLVLFGLSRLAVLRAKSEGKASFFEVERLFFRKP